MSFDAALQLYGAFTVFGDHCRDNLQHWGNQMIAAFQKTCAFMLAAQAILFFVPGKSYAKYVRVLVGIIMILQICNPLFDFFLSEDKYRQILQQGEEIEKEIDRIWNDSNIEESSMGIYDGIENELKERLSSAVLEYEVVQVGLLDGEGKALREGRMGNQAEKIVVSVRKKQAGTGIRIEAVQVCAEKAGEETGYGEPLPGSEESRLKKLFGACMDVEPQRIEIRFKT